MTAVSTEQELLRIPDSLFVHADLRVEVEQFLYFEATLLDERRYADWYLLFADDIHYWMPNRMNRLMQESDRENTTERETGLFDENKTSLEWRVKQLLTRKHWAEDPPSRARHLVSVNLSRRGGRSRAPFRRPRRASSRATKSSPSRRPRRS